ncbi:MAG: precorrin-6y C5,15-methyltransferase (decarboxylating) subunit CbiE [Rhodospirillaceae bacterium]
MSDASPPWLSVIGLHEDGLAGLGATARALVDGAETLVGDARMLSYLPEDGRERLIWPRPLTALFPEIERRRGRPVCVLASGDPLCHGIGALIAARFPASERVIIPAPTAFALARARLGWSEGEVETLSLHNRPLETLADALYPAARLVVLTRDGGTPAAVAAYLTERGFGASRLTVFERMNGPDEQRFEGGAEDWPFARLHDLNVLAIECHASDDACYYSRVVGLPDEAFLSDGVMTKREARALAVSALAPLPGELLWDVGAGCGTIGIEWLRAAGARARVLAIETKPERRALIAANRLRFGADRLDIIAGNVPGALAGLAAPDAIFIGGGLTVAGVLERCLAALKPGGRLVAHAVTLEAESVLLNAAATHGGGLVRVSVARAEPLGGFTGWRPQMPLTEWSYRKTR